mgnify:CR=1 FL=1
MTAKQKAARAKFKEVVKEASKLRKKNPKLTQAQAVKQAWAIEYSKAGSAPKKKAEKKIGYKIDRTAIVWKATPLVKKYIKSGMSRAKAIKQADLDAAHLRNVGTVKTKKAAAKKKAESIHKDTKSHNVNIRVVSGVKQIGNVKFYI